MRTHRIVFIGTSVVTFILLIALSAYFLFYTSFSSSSEHAYVYIDHDDNIDSVYVKTKAAALPRQMVGFKLLCHVLNYPENMKSGKYEVGNGISTIDFMRNLRNKNQVPVRLTIPNVRTLERLSAKLSKVIEPDSATLISYLRDSTQCAQYGYNKATISCIFIPNTYEVYWDITPEKLVAKMHKEYERFWTDERKTKAKSLGFNQVEVMTLASIVDQETANNGEKPAIAGMYLNRLRKGMLLQADPTVKFALQDFGLRRILHEHLKYDSPYNTYLYLGLPPGPISIPAITSIDAVLNAEKNDYIFMCAKEDFSGTHNFACSYSEHLKNARKYTRALNERGIK